MVLLLVAFLESVPVRVFGSFDDDCGDDSSTLADWYTYPPARVPYRLRFGPESLLLGWLLRVSLVVCLLFVVFPTVMAFAVVVVCALVATVAFFVVVVIFLIDRFDFCHLAALLLILGFFRKRHYF